MGLSLDERIQRETDLIKELEASYPKYDSKAGRWAKVNEPYNDHEYKVRDAYWRRRMLIAKRDGLDESETAKVY